MYVEGGAAKVLEELVKWLETQPPRTEYYFGNMCGDCLIGRLGKATGQDWRDLHNELYGARLLHIASHQPETYGAALERAKEALGKSAKADPEIVGA